MNKQFEIGIIIPGTDLVPLELVKLPKEKGGNRAYLCRCLCGNLAIHSISNIIIGRVKRCGYRCPNRPQNKPFGLEKAIERFWSRVEKTEKCWVWHGSTTQDGYGNLGFRGEPILAHRLSWRLTHGSIPEGIKVLHHCDNPPCVRPDHLFLGTQADNVRDCANKGRIRVGDRKGEKHPFSKLKNADVLEIRRLSGLGQTRTSISKLYGVCRQAIDDIVNRYNWIHI